MTQKGSNTPSSQHTTVVRKSEIDNEGQATCDIACSNPRRIRTVENFIVVWLHSDMDESNVDNSIFIDNLRQIITMIEMFTDIDSCVDYLRNVQDDKVFLIVSRALDQNIIAYISQLTQLALIYILCDDNQKYQQWISNFRKVKGVYTKIEVLCNELRADVRQSEKDLITISVIPSSSTIDLNELDQSFMYSQLLKEILLEVESTSTEKKQLVDFCRLQYAHNNNALKVIDEFEQKYPHPSVIWWYTRECFIYQMLNKALRTQDINIIMKMSFFVRDLHQYIEQLHSLQKYRQPSIVYRGQGMSNAEFEKIKKSKGCLLAFNNFLSTTTDRQVCYLFADSAVQNPDLTGLIFEISIDPNVSTVSFASLDSVSYFEEREKEILFSMHTVFRIREVRQIEERLFQIDLTLTNENDQQLTNLTQYIRQSIRGSTRLHRMSQLMLYMGEFDKAEVNYTTLINTISDDDRPELAFLHHQLGYINDEKGDLSSALSHYQQSLDNLLTYRSSDDPQLATTYSNIGLILQQQGDLSSALEQFERALNIDLQKSQSNHLNIATRRSNIGLVLSGQGKFEEALESYGCALKLQLDHLPLHHPNLATTYNNIGEAHREMGDNSSALFFFQKTLEIKQRSLPTHHSSLAITHNNLSYVFEATHQTEEAIEHAERAVEIGNHSLGANHPTVKNCQKHLDELRRKV